MSEAETILAFEKVSRQYASKSPPAVDEVSLEMSEGEIVALIGESGSGKTTLLRLAAGLEFPDAGVVRIGREVVADAASPRSEVPPEKRRLGLVFQDGALFPHLNAARNVAYGLKRLQRAERDRRVAECLSLVDLSGKEKRFPHELSGGERQRLALARALAPQPRLILLDEPFSHLDPALRRRLREEIRSILDSLNQTALVVTHDPEDALAIASRVAILNQGRILQTGSPAEVYSNPVDRYCAERFGPANRVVDPSTGDVHWKRPEDAIWVDDVDREENGAVTVTSVRPVGNRLEVRVIPQVDSGECWICLLDMVSAANLKAGDRGGIAWKGVPESNG